MRYFGDETFGEFLEMLRFPRALPEIKAIVMRNLWRIGFQSMEDVLNEVYSKDKFAFPSPRTAEVFFDNFSGLWSLLGAHQEQGNYFRFFRFPKTFGVNSLKVRIEARSLEIRALFPLVTDWAKELPEERLKYFQQIAAPVFPAIEHIKNILNDATVSSPDDAQIAEWDRELNGIDAILEEAFNQVGWLMVGIWRKQQETDFNSVNNPF
jgi:hypothetical protein